MQLIAPPSLRPAAARLRRQRGIGLFDSLVALVMLSAGLLGITQFQSRVVANATESQTRLAATQLGNELLDMAIVDPTNATCYTMPAAGACGSAAARAYTDAWNTRVAAALPGNDKIEATLNANNQLRITLTWASKSASDPVHELQVVASVQ